MTLKEPIANSTTEIPCFKVVYQFIGNNHAVRSNTLAFYAETADKARDLAKKFLAENNIRYLKILTTTKI